MKKTLLITLSLLLLLTGCGKQEKTPQTENVPVETPGQAVTEAPTAAPTEAPAEEPNEEAEGETQTPHKTGTAYLPVRMTVLDENGNESWYQEYSYDDYGREKQTTQYMDGYITYSATTAYTSDTEYETAIQRGGTGYSIRYTCDEAGRVVYQETVENGAVTEYTEYTYDDHGNQLTARMVYGGDETDFSYEYTYDGSGNQLSRKEYQNGELAGWLEMEYDAGGREISSVRYYPDGSISDETSVTWSGSTETRESRDVDGYVYMTLVTTYDETGNILTQETWQDGIMVSCTEYTYEVTPIIG